MTVLFFKHISNLFVSMIDTNNDKNAKTIIEISRHKDKLLNAISVIYSTKNSTSLNEALKSFRQSMKYHETHKIQFLDKDLGKLETAVEKFTKYKSFKLYGLDQRKEALREYKMYLKNSPL